MKIVGLCGGSGAGKGEVSRILGSLGALVLDTDRIYRELTSKRTPCLSALEEEFGSQIISEGGALDRRALSRIVFFGEGSEKKRIRLNEITHKYVLDEVRSRIKASGGEYRAAVVDAPLLFEAGFAPECDHIISVIADKNIRMGRICQRDGISESMAKKRIASQLSDEYLKEHSDFIIVNNGDLETLKKSVLSVAEKVLN